MSRTGKGFLYLLYFAAVAGLVTAIVMSFRSDRTQIASTSSSVRQGQSIPNKPTTNPTTSPSKNSPSPPSNPTATTSNQATNTPSTPSSTSTTSGTNTLVNTGPGSSVSLFLAISLLGFFLYRQRMLGRINRR